MTGLHQGDPSVSGTARGRKGCKVPHHQGKTASALPANGWETWSPQGTAEAIGHCLVQRQLKSGSQLHGICDSPDCARGMSTATPFITCFGIRLWQDAAGKVGTEILSLASLLLSSVLPCSWRWMHRKTIQNGSGGISPNPPLLPIALTRQKLPPRTSFF